MNENIKNIAYTMGKSNVLCTEDCGNCIQTEDNCKLIRQATALDKAGYRKQTDVAREFAERAKIKLTDEDGWEFTWRGLNLCKEIDKIAKEYGKEE